MNVPVIHEKEIASVPYSRVIVGSSCQEHYHSFFEFSICTGGSFKNCINDVWHDISRGRVILLRPTDKHYFVAEEPHTARDIYVSNAVLKSVCNSVDRTLYSKLLKNSLAIDFSINDFQLQLIENKLNYFNNTYEKTELQLKAMHRAVVLDIIQLWLEKDVSTSTKLPEWISLLTSQIGSEKFLTRNIEEIVATTNYSHGYVCREFKKHVGITLQDYIANAKFSYAIALLESGDISVSQIADRLGYNAASNFTIAFKNKFGVSPAKWIKNKR